MQLQRNEKQAVTWVRFYTVTRQDNEMIRRRSGEAKHHHGPVCTLQTFRHVAQALAADVTQLNPDCLFRVTHAMPPHRFIRSTVPPCLCRSLSGRPTVRRTWRRH